jgi:hypothetical protein
MHYSLPPPPLDAHGRTAWQTQMGAAVHTPDLVPALVRRQPALFPRYTVYYTQLRALPRRVRRALQRQWRLPLAGVALMLSLGQSPGLAATIPVGGACTLIDAITAANTDTATGGCPAGSGVDTIVLPPDSTHALTAVNNHTYGPTGLPVITSAITIEGQGSTITRDNEAAEFRLFAVGSTGELRLQETVITGGIAPVHPSGVPNDSGGGILNVGGTWIVSNSSILNNTAAFRGGGVLSVGGTFNLFNSILSGNAAVAGEGQITAMAP